MEVSGQNTLVALLLVKETLWVARCASIWSGRICKEKLKLFLFFATKSYMVNIYTLNCLCMKLICGQQVSHHCHQILLTDNSQAYPQ